MNIRAFMGLLALTAALPSAVAAQRDSGERSLDYDLDYDVGDDRVTGPGHNAGDWSGGWDDYEEEWDGHEEWDDAPAYRDPPRYRPPPYYRRPPPLPPVVYHPGYPAIGPYYAPPGATTIIIQPSMITTTTVVEEYYEPAPARTAWRAKAKTGKAWKPKPRCVCR